MLEVHDLSRYHISHSIVFEQPFDPAADALISQLALREFCEKRGCPPHALNFTFREPTETAFNTEVGDTNAQNACQFMKELIADPEIGEMLAGIPITVEIVDMSAPVAATVHRRILNREF